MRQVRSTQCCCLVLKLGLTLVTSWAGAHQAPLSMDFSKQEYWSGLPFPSPGIFQTQGSNPNLLHWQVDSLPLSHQGSMVHSGYSVSADSFFHFPCISFCLFFVSHSPPISFKLPPPSSVQSFVLIFTECFLRGKNF